MTTPPRSTITLRALSGRPLENEQVRSIVVSTAWAIGERTGIEVLAVHPSPDRIEVVLACSQIAAIGFAAELRRLTEQWYAQKHPDSGHLWGSPRGESPRDTESDQNGWRPEHEDDDDWWRGGERDLGPPG